MKKVLLGLLYGLSISLAIACGVATCILISKLSGYGAVLGFICAVGMVVIGVFISYHIGSAILSEYKKL